MSRDQFYNLVKELNPFITPNPLSPNRRALSADKKLAITLYYLKDTRSLPMTANTFGVAANTLGSVVYEVCMAISEHLELLFLPKNRKEMMEKVSEFEVQIWNGASFWLCRWDSHPNILSE